MICVRNELWFYFEFVKIKLKKKKIVGHMLVSVDWATKRAEPKWRTRWQLDVIKKYKKKKRVYFVL